MTPDSSNQSQPVSASQRQIDHGDSDAELTRALKQRNFVTHRNNRVELCFQKAAYAFHQAKMPIRQKRTTSVVCRHLFISRSPLAFEGLLDPELVSMTSKIY